MQQTYPNKKRRPTVTIDEDDGEMSYKEISEFMTRNGTRMNYTSVRNHLLRAMRKIVAEMGTRLGRRLDAKQIETIAKSPGFQRSIASILARRH